MPQEGLSSKIVGAIAPTAPTLTPSLQIIDNFHKLSAERNNLKIQTKFDWVNRCDFQWQFCTPKFFWQLSSPLYVIDKMLKIPFVTALFCIKNWANFILEWRFVRKSLFDTFLFKTALNSHNSCSFDNFWDNSGEWIKNYILNN